MVLLVDDAPVERRLFAMARERASAGFILREAGDGNEALAYLRGEGEFGDRAAHPLPALVVLDVNMPGHSGFEVLAELRNDAALGTLPVVMFTSSANEADVRRAYALGANSYLVKPLSLAVLIDMVRMLDHYWFRLNRAPVF